MMWRPLLHPWIVLFGFLWVHLGSCTYRFIHISNTDVCNRKAKLPFQSKEKELTVGEGAILLQLKSPSIAMQKNYRNQREVCEIQIEAPANHGIMAYVEEMHMRKSTKDNGCVDFLQFGQNDIIPFITLRKSKRLCGKINGKSDARQGYGFNEPGGSLLVWINLGGRRGTSHWPEIGLVNLTLIVTSYRKDDCKGSSKFRACDGHVSKCIRKEYFCDRHFNCPLPTSNASKVSRSFDELTCEYKEPEPETTPSPDEDAGFSLSDLNLISWTLIIVCTTLVLTLFILICCRAKRARQRQGEKCLCCCLGSGRRRNSCDFSDHQYPTRSVAELSSMRQRQGEAEQNVYLPLSVMGRRSASPREAATTLPLPEEAPPAYHEIFPDGAPESFDLNIPQGALRQIEASVEDDQLMERIPRNND